MLFIRETMDFLQNPKVYVSILLLAFAKSPILNPHLIQSSVIRSGGLSSTQQSSQHYSLDLVQSLFVGGLYLNWQSMDSLVNGSRKYHSERQKGLSSIIASAKVVGNSRNSDLSFTLKGTLQHTPNDQLIRNFTKIMNHFVFAVFISYSDKEILSYQIQSA